MRIVAILILAAAIAALPDSSFGRDFSAIPCSLAEIEEGFRNWLDHRENADWCAHPVADQFRQDCPMKFWGYKLD